MHSCRVFEQCQRSNIKHNHSSRTHHAWLWPTWPSPTPEQRTFWLELYDAFNAARATWLMSFADVIQRRFPYGSAPPLDELLASTTFGFDFLSDERGYQLAPHTDKCQKLLSLLLYLPEPGPSSNEQFGTALYVPSDAAPLRDTRCGEQHFTFDGYAVAGRAPYRGNTAFAFVPCSSSWHGVPQSTIARRAIFA